MRLKMFCRAISAAALLPLLVPVSLLAQKSHQAKDDDDDDAPVSAQVLPNTGQTLTPLAPRGARFEPLNPGLADNPQWLAGQAVTTATSPDHKTLLILTSGYNLYNYPSGAYAGSENKTDSNEYVFVYDISKPLPVQKQVLQVENTYAGVVWDPNGSAFYVSGGKNDNVHLYAAGATGLFAEEAGSPVTLGHAAGNGLAVSPEAAGIAITADGKTLVVADYYNDSISLLSRGQSGFTKTGELDLRPGKVNATQKGMAGGEYPFWVTIVGTTAFVSSVRDREIDVVSLAGTPQVTNRIHVKGQPNKMVANADGSRLYVAEDETDSVAVINTKNDVVLETISVTAPYGLLPGSRAGLKGTNTNSVTLSPDQGTLYVTNGNTNNVAVVKLSSYIGQSRVEGLIPTGWYPNSVSVSADGKQVYVVNGKSPTGPNPGNCHGVTTALAAACAATNQYDLQLVKAGFQSFPTPTPGELNKLTELVADNNHFQRVVSEEDRETMQFLRLKIKHVIYIIKENRTYDQVLGDLEVGNGDPALTEFGRNVTPNLHKLARKFVDLDNFYDSSEVSMDGWPWSTSAQAPDVVEKQTPVNYAGRGLSYDSEGTNRNINVAYPTLAERVAANPLTPADPDVLPGTTDTAAPDSPAGVINQGYLWDAALRNKLTVRNYGFLLDLTRYELPAAYAALSVPEILNPAATHKRVAYPANVALAPFTDPYFRGFDQSFPDYYRFEEWKREFTGTYGSGGLPSLTLLRLAHDHTGNFSTALLGINTPELEVADNDYAVGLVAETVAHSIYKDNTLIFVIEDDAQDGGDHVDAHRSIAFIVGPYVKQHAVVSKTYNTVNFVRTMEDILGIGQLNLNDAVAAPMASAFDVRQKDWTYTAVPSPLLYGTQLPLPPKPASTTEEAMRTTHKGEYWADVTKGFDFSIEDHMDGAAYNRVLWRGLMGGEYPQRVTTGLDLRKNRSALLARFYQKQSSTTEGALHTTHQPTGE